MVQNLIAKWFTFHLRNTYCRTNISEASHRTINSHSDCSHYLNQIAVTFWSRVSCLCIRSKTRYYPHFGPIIHSSSCHTEYVIHSFSTELYQFFGLIPICPQSYPHMHKCSQIFCVFDKIRLLHIDRPYVLSTVCV